MYINRQSSIINRKWERAVQRLNLAAEPLDVFAYLRSQGYKIFLHTQTGHGWSYLVKPGKVFHPSSFDALASGQRTVNISDGPPFQSGWIAVLAYDLARRYERLPDSNPELVGIPEATLIESDEHLAYDHDNAEWWFCGGGAAFEPERIQLPIAAAPHSDENWSVSEWTARPDAEQYRSMVVKAKDYIARGDIYQVNLARWFSARFSGDPFAWFASLSRINPSPYAAYVELPDDPVHDAFGNCPQTVIVSSSPELLISVDGTRLVTRPIAGTYAKDKSAKDLKRDPKERAEHVMLIDLERNDLGRVAVPGTVVVEELLATEEYSHLHHIVSQVAADLRSGESTDSILRAIFPGGTITGAPKIRAMEIIDELESFRRGLYTGSIGYIDRTGDRLKLNIAIRTALIRQNRVHLAAGAGIVADSDPDREERETRIKAAAFLESSLCNNATP